MEQEKRRPHPQGRGKPLRKAALSKQIVWEGVQVTGLKRAPEDKWQRLSHHRAGQSDLLLKNLTGGQAAGTGL